MKIITLELILSICFFTSCQNAVFYNKIPKILGLSKITIEKYEVIDELGGFGEGYALEEYTLSEKTIKEFESLKSKELPEKKDTIKNWSRKNWSRFIESDSEIFSIGLNYLSKNERIQFKITTIKKVLQEQKFYYSFYCRPDETNPQDIQLFILDVSNRKLYIIEVNI
jgi:hypothetical protein